MGNFPKFSDQSFRINNTMAFDVRFGGRCFVARPMQTQYTQFNEKFFIGINNPEILCIFRLSTPASGHAFKLNYLNIYRNVRSFSHLRPFLREHGV